jgi:hypothetical protein
MGDGALSLPPYTPDVNPIEEALGQAQVSAALGQGLFAEALGLRIVGLFPEITPENTIA